jgi:hypothetical protein
VGAAYFIVLDNPVDGLNTEMDGKSLARAIESLDDAARALGLRPLSEFVSVSPLDAADLLEEHGIDPDDLETELPPLVQFSADEGLAVARALAAHPLAQDPGVAQDLRDCQRILGAASRHGARWHFAVDF